MSDSAIDSSVKSSANSSPTRDAGGVPPQPPSGSLPAAPDNAGGDDATPTKDPKWFWLSVGQYVVLSVVGILFVYFLFSGLFGTGGKFLAGLKDHDLARGVITYLVAGTTVAIAMILVMASIFSGGKDLDKRFTLGKEVLTVLTAVLGTIIGFYYGASTKTDGAGSRAASAIYQAANLKFTPEQPKVGTPFNLSGNIIGGTPPYTYSIKFDPDVMTPPVTDQVSQDGKISHDLQVSGEAKPGEVSFVIEIKDKNGKVETLKEETQKITVTGP
jgi:hypothetical protein